MNNVNEFIEKYYPNASDKDRKLIEFHMDRIERDNLNSADKIYEIFGSGIGRTKFFYMKKLMRNWFEFVGNNELSNTIDEYSFDKYSEGNMPALFKTAKQMDTKILAEYKKASGMSDGLYRFRTECILSWYGFEVDEIVALKKDEIDFDTNFIRSVGREVHIDDYSAYVLLTYVKSDERDLYAPANNGSKLIPSEYLLRGSKEKQFHVKNVSIDFQKYLEKTNNKLPLERKIILFNGMFDEMKRYEDEEGYSPISAMKEVLKERGRSTSEYQGIQPFYKKWKKIKA